MQELEEAERYSVAALFTLALHSAAAQADIGGEGWGYVCFLLKQTHSSSPPQHRQFLFIVFMTLEKLPILHIQLASLEV